MPFTNPVPRRRLITLAGGLAVATLATAARGNPLASPRTRQPVPAGPDAVIEPAQAAPTPEPPGAPILAADEQVHTYTPDHRVALTFDDGPDPVYTPRLLDVLAAHQVNATFFLLGSAVAAHPKLVRRIAAAGHTIGNHSMHHDYQLGQADRDTIVSELSAVNDLLVAAGAPAVPYFRAPGGYWTPRLVQIARELQMTAVGWSVDPKDWSMPAAAKLAAGIASTEPGSIVLLHDGGGDRQHTLDALAEVLPQLVTERELTAL